MKFQWSIQPSHTQLALSRVTYLNYRNEHIWPPTRTWLHIFEAFHLASYNSWHLIILIFTSLFEIDVWNFWYFNLMIKPLVFGHHTFQHKSLSLFPSQILVCATTFSAHYLFSRFNIGWALKQKKKKVCGKRYSTSLRMSQDQQNYWLIIHYKFEDLLTTIT